MVDRAYRRAAELADTGLLGDHLEEEVSNIASEIRAAERRGKIAGIKESAQSTRYGMSMIDLFLHLLEKARKLEEE